jgi:hypothetical protein
MPSSEEPRAVVGTGRRACGRRHGADRPPTANVDCPLTLAESPRLDGGPIGDILGQARQHGAIQGAERDWLRLGTRPRSTPCRLRPYVAGHVRRPPPAGWPRRPTPRASQPRRESATAGTSTLPIPDRWRKQAARTEGRAASSELARPQAACVRRWRVPSPCEPKR